MLSIDIEDVGSFMKALLVGEKFDGFLTGEAVITTFARVEITGDLNKDYFDTDEQQMLGNRKLAFWKEIKPIAFNLIKGKKLPTYIKITLKMSNYLLGKVPEEVREVLAGAKGLYITVKYEQKMLKVITGVQLAGFTLDKSVDRAWDEYVKTII